MHIECKQLRLNKDGRIVSTIVVENHASDSDTIKRIKLVGEKTEAEGNEPCMESIPLTDVALSPREKWEGTFTWNKNASDKVKQLGEAMVFVEFSESEAVSCAFRFADVQGGDSAANAQSGEGAAGSLRQRLHLIGWPLIMMSLFSGLLAIIHTSERNQQQEEIAKSLEAMPADFVEQAKVRAMLEEVAAETPSLHYHEASSAANSDSTAFMDAAMSGDMNTVTRLLDQGVDVNAKDAGGSTALMYASWRGYVEIVKRLLGKDANVNAQDSHGMTALGHASQEGHADIVKLLIDNGADVNAKDEDGMTILIYASQKGERNDETMKLLLDHGADVNAKNKYGATALIYASRAGSIKKVKRLLAKGADADAVDKNGLTALMYATQAGHADIVNLLQK